MLSSSGWQVRATVRFGFPIGAASSVDLMEEHPEPRVVEGDAVAGIAFGPFEIVTLRVR